MSASPGNLFLEELAGGLNTVLTNVLHRAFGPGLDQSAYGAITWMDILAAGCFMLLALLVNAAMGIYFHRKAHPAELVVTKWRQLLVASFDRPLYLLVWLCGFYLATVPLLARFPQDEVMDVLRDLLDRMFSLGIFAVVFWLFFRFTHVLEAKLKVWATRTGNKAGGLFIPLLGQGLRAIVPVVGIIVILPLLGLPPEFYSVISKGTGILIIATVGLVAIKTVTLGERLILARYDISVADNLEARKVHTQAKVISKILYAIIVLVCSGCILMLFEVVRHFGQSILASAGVVGVIIGFAAQKTIANLFAGFQLALTQPIRLDDVVIVEGEWGRVEEITLTYVVIRIWDDRRLVVPLSYFIEKPFQNWTRVSADLMGSVFLWVDYSLPLENLRVAAKGIIESHPLWDKRFWNLQVTDSSENSMQIRVLATSADSSRSWELRCDIREQLIVFIQKNYPQSLPQRRNNQFSNPTGNPSGNPPAKP